MKSCQALLAAFVCAVLPLHAADLSDLIYTTTDVNVTITDCKTTASGVLVIPDTIEGKPVTSIGDAPAAVKALACWKKPRRVILLITKIIYINNSRHIGSLS